MTLDRITANDHADALSVTATNATITASSTSRTLAGPLVIYNVVGRTSRGPLRVRPGALRFPDDLGRVKLTREHFRDDVRGHLTAVEHTDDGIRASFRVSDGPLGDAALQEATDRTRDAFSFDVVDATIVGDTITDALVIAGGQVGIPAYDNARIDTIAASNHAPEGNIMTESERARLRELAALNNRTAEQETEYQSLAARAVSEVTADPAEAPAEPAAPAAEATASGGEQVAASVPSVPAGVPQTHRPAATTQPQGGAFGRFVSEVTAGLRTRAESGSTASITAALADVTHSAHTSNIEAPAWTGELWSGLVYEPEFYDLFVTGPLTHWEGKGWRFTSKLKMQDYAGDKAEIPTSTITTESSSYEAARAAVGVDIDRKFFDFPNEGFVASLFEQARESWAIIRDEKVRAYVLAKAAAAKVDEANAASANLAAQPTLLKASAAAVRSLKRRKVGRASWVMVNDDDLFSLMDVAEKDVSAFLELFGIDPSNFRSSEAIPQGTVLAGVKQSATFRELPGSPVRVEAQNLTRAGVDEAFFAYWAIEEHHKSGITKVTFTPPA